ncbi:MAG: DNA internalization-related competence protein ComEC/Rec2, partial [Acidobacteria bacterium]|nr:DNA internalization-related competence protein ComEC/Rec2 [Acidobacteriota bacterium]
MSHPAWIPALGVLAGAAAGTLDLDRGQWGVLLLLALAWLAGACAFARRGQLTLVASIGLGFAGAGYLLASSALQQAVNPPVRRFFDDVAARQGTSDPDTPFIVDGILLSDAAASEAGATFRLSAAHIRFEGFSSDTSGSIAVAVGGSLAPGHLAQWRAGRRVRAPILLRYPTRYHNFAVADRERWQASRGAPLSGFVKSAALIECVSNGPWYAEVASATRTYVRQAIDRTVGGWNAQSAAIVTAIIIGDRAGLSADIERRLQEAGTYHVIAISGGNIAIFVAILLTMGRVTRLAARPAVVLTMVALVGYAYIAGAGASVSRATMMAMVYLAARIFDHHSSPLNGLATAAAIMLCGSPLTLVDAGFMLTFGATLGIVLGVPHVMRLIERSSDSRDCHGDARGQRDRPSRISALVWRNGCALFAASLAAELALLPIGASLFARVTFAGLILNFAAIPLMALAQCAGLAAIALQALPGKLGVPALGVGYAAHVGAGGLVRTAALVDVAPWLSMRVVPPPVWLLCGYYLAWALALWSRSRGHDVVMLERLRPVRFASAVVPLLVVVWIVINPGSAGAGTDEMRVTFIDVGQGDSTLLRLPGGQNLLVDTGGVVSRGDYDFGERVVSPALWGLGITRVERLALTHGDPDHIGAAPAVVRNFDVHEVWEGVAVPRHPALMALRGQTRERGIAWRTLRAGDGLRVAGARLTLWHPPAPEWERQRVRNDDSLVVDVSFGDVSVLLTGDIGREVERDLARRIPRASLRVLKVPHHGSLTSSSWEFVSAVRPTVAIVSAGRGNRYGHPAPAVLERYRRVGAVI